MVESETDFAVLELKSRNCCCLECQTNRRQWDSAMAEHAGTTAKNQCLVLRRCLGWEWRTSCTSVGYDEQVVEARF